MTPGDSGVEVDGVIHEAHGSRRAKKMKGCAGDTGEERKERRTGLWERLDALVPLHLPPSR